MMKIKKVIPVILSMIVLFVGIVTVPALAQEVQVIVNGQAVIFPDQQPFINQDNRTLVPVRAPMEAAGATVSWNDKTRQVTVTKGDKTAVFTIGSKVYTINGKAMQMDTTAQIAGSRTVFPIRFVAEAIGLTVEWNAQNQTVAITSTTAPEAQPEVTPAKPKNTNPLPPDEARKPMTSLTPEAKARLMAYPYPVDGNGKQYKINYPMVEYNKLPSRDGKTLLDHMMVPIQINKVLKTNQKLFTDGDLCYRNDDPQYPARIRGILQTSNSDGLVTEQDVEYGFFYGTYFVKPGEPTVPSHWFSEYDTVQLSVPIEIK